MNFIKKIHNKKEDELVHLQFQKFSKGEFRNKAIVEVKKTGKGYAIKTSAEFANELVRIMAEKLGDAETKVTGAIVSTTDLTGKIEFKDKKQFQGVKRYLIDNTMKGKEILNMLDEFPKNFFALSFSVGDEQLKIKAKAPKSAKPGKGDAEVKADFCVLKTPDENIAKSFVLEKENFKEAKFNHTFFIDSIEIPEELKNSEDFALVREKSKRKGRIIRTGSIDGEEVKSEMVFEA
jgi:hypothetical protein